MTATAPPVPGNVSPLLPDVDEIQRALRVLVGAGNATELRLLNVSTPHFRRPHTVSGYYADLTAMARDAAKYAPYASGAYFVPNAINPALLARARNRCRPVERDPLTSDHDIIHRRWLLVDLDPKRPAGISSSDEEHDAALRRARAIWRHLHTLGWPDPVVADSGNGAHLLYPIDLSADDGGVVQRTLEALAREFNDDRVTIDTTVHNAARIWKLPGTPARKGDHTPERPHRLARLLHVPPALEPEP